MTARATFTQAQLERAIRAADARGKVAAVRLDGMIFFVPPDKIALEGDKPDEFGEYLARRSKRRSQGQDAPAKGRG